MHKKASKSTIPKNELLAVETFLETVTNSASTPGASNVKEDNRISVLNKENSSLILVLPKKLECSGAV